jgi:3-hydroxyacyl-[acyl-carrier-protein] dehydratase
MTDAIQSQLPHRSPFLHVDRVLIREFGVRVVAVKLVSHSDPGLGGTSGPAVSVPGPLLLEMLAQAGGFLEPDSLHGQEILLAGVQEAQFHASVFVGDRLELEVRPDAAFGPISRIRGEIRRDGSVICSANLLLRKGSPEAGSARSGRGGTGVGAQRETPGEQKS